MSKIIVKGAFHLRFSVLFFLVKLSGHQIPWESAAVAAAEREQKLGFFGEGKVLIDEIPVSVLTAPKRDGFFVYVENYF